MQFGVRVADAPPIVENDGMYLRNFKKGDTVIRLIDEYNDWFMFYEHYMPEQGYFPCTGAKEACPGCTHDSKDVQRASRRFATNAFFVENKYVAPVRIPATLAKKFANRAERNGTITNRDYTVMKTGEGITTEYDVEQEDKYALDMDALREQASDIPAILKANYDAIWGESTAVKKEQSEKAPFDKGEEEEIDEDALMRMTGDELFYLAKRHGISVDDNMTRQEILSEILA